MKNRKRSTKELMSGLAFIAPSLLGFLVFTLIPVVISLYLSFTEWNFMQGMDAIKWIGLKNYTRLFSDPWFRSSYKNNILFTFGTTPALIALGLVIATIINKHVYGGSIVRTMIFVPYIASVVAVCTVWMVLLQPSFGPVNSVLRAIGIENPPGWLVDYKWSLPSIMLVYVWQQVGYYSIVFMAGLKGISEDVYEAASIDGASTIRQFFSITIPLISPTTFFLLIMGIIGSFKVFDQISVLTQGGPGNSSSVMAFYVYRTAFEYYDMGYANALAWALFVLIFIVTLVQYRMEGRFSAD